jgi:hypothetical protein
MVNIHPERNSSAPLVDVVTFRDTRAKDPLEAPLSAIFPHRPLLEEPLESNSVSIDALLPRLDGLLSVLKTCVGTECSDPWRVLHPKGHVRSLRDALHEKYDGFYHGLEKVRFEKCERGYIKESEWPKEPGMVGGGMVWEVDVNAGREEMGAEGDRGQDWALRTEL